MTRSSFYTGACSVLIGVAVYATALHVTPLIIASAMLLCILAYSEYAHSTVRRSVDLKQSLSILVVIVLLIVAYLGTFTHLTAFILGLVSCALSWLSIRLNTTGKTAGTEAEGT